MSVRWVSRAGGVLSVAAACSGLEHAEHFSRCQKPLLPTEHTNYNARDVSPEPLVLQMNLPKMVWREVAAVGASLKVAFLDLAKADAELKAVPSWADPVWHLFVVRHEKRAELQKFLAERGIATQIHYPIPPHLTARELSHTVARLREFV